MGNPGVGSLRRLRAAIESGELDWEEYSHFGMISRLRAGASGLPFMPMNPTGAEDLASYNPNYQQVNDPYTGKPVVVVPPLTPDVAIVHVQRADVQGNAQVWGILGEQQLAAFASQRVVLTVEEIVDEAVIRSDPNRTIIPGMVVRCRVSCAVLCASLPTPRVTMIGITSSTWPGMRSAKPRRASRPILMSGCMGCPTGGTYWEKLGPDVHRRLSAAERLSQPVNYGALLNMRQ
jgi:glutaconate CoA-transferase, subunit A